MVLKEKMKRTTEETGTDVNTGTQSGLFDILDDHTLCCVLEQLAGSAPVQLGEVRAILRLSETCKRFRDLIRSDTAGVVVWPKVDPSEILSERAHEYSIKRCVLTHRRNVAASKFFDLATRFTQCHAGALLKNVRRIGLALPCRAMLALVTAGRRTLRHLVVSLFMYSEDLPSVSGWGGVTGRWGVTTEVDSHEPVPYQQVVDTIAGLPNLESLRFTMDGSMALRTIPPPLCMPRNLTSLVLNVDDRHHRIPCDWSRAVALTDLGLFGTLPPTLPSLVWPTSLSLGAATFDELSVLEMANVLFPRLRHLTVHTGDTAKLATCVKTGAMRDLTALDIGIPITALHMVREELLSALATWVPNLEVLYMLNGQTTPAGVLAIAGLLHLRKLRMVLARTSATADFKSAFKTMGSVSGAVSLHKLHIAGVRIPIDALLDTPRCAELTHLVVSALSWNDKTTLEVILPPVLGHLTYLSGTSRLNGLTGHCKFKSFAIASYETVSADLITERVHITAASVVIRCRGPPEIALDTATHLRGVRRLKVMALPSTTPHAWTLATIGDMIKKLPELEVLSYTTYDDALPLHVTFETVGDRVVRIEMP
jgi:hypothetical protein